MTVKELIEKLSYMDPDAKVFVSRSSEDRDVREVLGGDVKKGDWWEVEDANGDVHTGKVVVIETWG